MLKTLGNILIIGGTLAVFLGLILRLSGKFKWIGRLPGDIIIHKGNFTFYFPLVTCLLISLSLSLIIFLVFKLRQKLSNQDIKSASLFILSLTYQLSEGFNPGLLIVSLRARTKEVEKLRPESFSISSRVSIATSPREVGTLFETLS